MVKRILPLLSVIVVFSGLMQAVCLADTAALLEQARQYEKAKNY